MAKYSLDKGYTEVQFLPLLYTLLTQLVEYLPYKEEVVSSNLTGCIPFFWGFNSFGRVLALQARSGEFESRNLHKNFVL